MTVAPDSVLTTAVPAPAGGTGFGVASLILGSLAVLASCATIFLPSAFLASGDVATASVALGAAHLAIAALALAGLVVGAIGLARREPKALAGIGVGAAIALLVPYAVSLVYAASYDSLFF